MKVKFLGVAIALCSLLIPQVAQAKWVHLINDIEGNKLLVGNMQKDGDIVTFWETIAQPGEEKPIAELIKANCQNGAFQIQQRTDGTNYSTATFPVQQAPFGSMYAHAIQYACATAH